MENFDKKDEIEEIEERVKGEKKNNKLEKWVIFGLWGLFCIPIVWATIEVYNWTGGDLFLVFLPLGMIAIGAFVVWAIAASGKGQKLIQEDTIESFANLEMYKKTNNVGNIEKEYQEKIQPIVAEFNKKRTVAKKKMLFCALGSLILVLLVIWYSSSITMRFINPYIIYLMPPILIILSTVVLIFSMQNKFISNIKPSISPEIIKLLGEDLSYSANKGISEEDFKKSELFRGFNKYYVQDYIEGTTQGKKMQMSEIRAIYDSHSKDMDSITVIFNGTFIIVEREDDFEDYVKIVTNFGKDKGILKNITNNRDKVELENIEFEKLFDVYSNNQIYAREIVTLPFMENLVYLSYKLDADIQISFLENKIYIALEGLTVIDDYKLFKKGLTVETITAILENINEIINIADYIAK